MAPWIATCICSSVVLGLFWLDRDRDMRTSGSLWLPVVWLFLCCSRSVSQWLGLGQPISTDSPTEGNPVDRLVYFSLILVGLVVLARRRRAAEIVRANVPIVLSFLYCAASILWSDYPDIAFKRWVKALGDFVMVLVVISDRDRLGAIKRLLTRTGFLVIPFSILLIKYYPDLGRGYSRWEGTAFYNGVATTKNALGMACLLFGLSALWRIFGEIQTRPRPIRRRPAIAQWIMFIMVVWLFWIVNSMTSLWCLIMGGTLLVATSFRPVAKRLAVVHSLVAAVILIPFSTLFAGVGTDLAHGATGRNISTLTDRTEVWAASLRLAGNSFFGTGFESFWLGPRLETMWSLFWWRPNEAHNGYLEVFLNLGWMGIAMLVIIIVTGYQTVIAAVRRSAPESNFMLASFAVAIVYNFTEAAFFRMMTPVWVVFLLAITIVPRRDIDQSHRTGILDNTNPLATRHGQSQLF